MFLCVFGGAGGENGNTIYLMRQLLKWDEIFARLKGHSNRMFRSRIEQHC